MFYILKFVLGLIYK